MTESNDGSGFPVPAYSLASADSELLDLAGLVLGYSELYALTDTHNADIGGAQPALAYFDGDPFPADDQLADGESTAHDRALAMLRIALVDLDRMHGDPASGVLVDHVAMTGATPTRGTTVATTSVAYALLALRTARRSLGSQLELYSNNTPDTAVTTTPLDPLAIHYPGNAALAFSGRLDAMLQAQAALLYDHLTDASGRAWTGWDVVAGAHVDETDVLDSHTAAVRGLFAAYLATGDARYHDRAIAVFDRIQAVFYDPAARIYSVAPAPTDSVEYTPMRFALLQSALRDVYELVATRPGGETLEPLLEARIGRLNKLVLNGWDDRDADAIVQWPDECVDVDAAGLPHGGLEMAERTLTGELGSLLQALLLPGDTRTPTSDREHDCVPEIDDAQPAGGARGFDHVHDREDAVKHLVLVVLAACGDNLAAPIDAAPIATCAATFTGNFAEVSSTTDNCPVFRSGGLVATDLSLDVEIAVAAVGTSIGITIDLGAAPTPGVFSSETTDAWSALAVAHVASGACIYNAGTTAIPVGSFVLTLDSLVMGQAATAR